MSKSTVAPTPKVDRVFKVSEAVLKTSASRSSLYRFVDLGLLPPPRKVGLRSSGWLESELDAFLAAGRERADAEYATRRAARDAAKLARS